ncbi:hypothetical protein EZV73_10995 [Acidaminobacter sp. JC074]|uniref:hypothetical protein n=1 Tax=Acidaminobacter sp. JC074 TaxID=2530199 RepID=UPI001F0FA3C0|nr:hypothetical protein [Acidaminobacter sp. JC074]MCH4888103.1 hypothetical protein [Acidaminobacter sp. JC074]
MNFKKVSVILLVLMMLFTMGCSNEEAASLSYDGSLKIEMGDQTVEIPYNDIYKMTPVKETYKTVTSSGEEIVTDIVGVSLNGLLKEQGKSLADFNGIRGIAGDGYAIDVPAEIIADKDIMLIWSEDGENYVDKKLPLRMAINDERSMYWVSNLMEVQCLMETETAEVESVALNQIVFIEPASKTLDQVDITYYEADDKGVKVTDLFKSIQASDPVVFVATDGFEKTEKLEVLEQGLLKLTGENAPLFMSPDLPKGMHVKMILQLTSGNTAFMSANNAMEAFTSMSFEDNEGVSLIELIDQAGIKADSYVFTSTDGYSVELSGKDVKKGILIKDEDIFKVKFEGQPKNTTVKDIYSIAAGAGGADQAEASETEVAELPAWSIEFTGLSDGSFEFTSDRAQRKLDLYTVEAVKTSKDGASYDQVWEGYRILDVLDFLQVEDFTELKVVATDGYEMVFTRDQVDENMLLGVIEDGQPVKEKKGHVQLMTSSLTSNFWVKNIATIEVK